MERTGKFKSYINGDITFTVGQIIPEELERLRKADALDIKATIHRDKRSKDANALLWACIGELTDVTGRDKWTEYLALLKEYGKYTYIVVKENAVEAMKKQWREVEIVGEYDMHGEKAIQLLCYFGSSTYDTKEFSKLLNGVKYEMEQAGLQPPPSGEMKRALEQWEKTYGKNG